jgi:hypothetical protein
LAWHTSVVRSCKGKRGEERAKGRGEACRGRAGQRRGRTGETAMRRAALAKSSAACVTRGDSPRTAV